MKYKKQQRITRHKRVTEKIQKSKGIPRLVVFRSNKYVYAQIIDDIYAKTLASASDLKSKTGHSKTEKAKEVGVVIAKEAIKKNVKKVVFDRAGYKFHGRVKAVAEGAREGGLAF
jgi:large subunit ribosomal protein L18